MRWLAHGIMYRVASGVSCRVLPRPLRLGRYELRKDRLSPTRIELLGKGSSYARRRHIWTTGIWAALLVAASLLVNVPSALAASSWSLDTSTNTSTSQGNTLEGVSCVSASFCMAVGYYSPGGHPAGSNQTIIEEWNGTAWSSLTAPDVNTTAANVLYAVSCTSISFCVATGGYGSTYQTLAEVWNGSAWSLMTPLDTSTAKSNIFYSVSCIPGTSTCIAAGYYVTSAGADQTLTELWNGSTWTIETSVDTSTTANNFFIGNSCLSTTFCMAAGYSGLTTQALTEEWNGSAWSIVASQDTSTTVNNYLNAVGCATTTFCMAVGYYGSTLQNLVEEWTGSTYTIVASPDTGTTLTNFLQGVSCTSTTFCQAVGYAIPSGGSVDQTLVETWDGTAWTIVSSPNPDTTTANLLQGVSCPSATFCMADNQYTDSAGTVQTLIEEFTVTGSGSLTITAPGSISLGTSIAPGATIAAAALGTLGYTNTLSDGLSWSVTVATTDLYNSGTSATLPFTDMSLGVGQTVSCSLAAPSAGAAGPTAFSGTDTTPGTTFSSAITAASGTSAQGGTCTQTGDALTVNVPANLLGSGAMTATVQYTITG